jgi:hypothetical protein
MVINSDGKPEDAGNRAERKMVEEEGDYYRKRQEPHFVKYADGRGVVAFPNGDEADAAALNENQALFRAANARRGGAGRNGRFANAAANAAEVIGPDHADYGKMKADEGGGPKSSEFNLDARVPLQDRPWKDVPKAQQYFSMRGERMVHTPEGLIPWKGPKSEVAREAANGGVGRRINEQGQRDLIKPEVKDGVLNVGPNKDPKVGRRAVMDARGFREIDDDGNTIPPKTKEPVKAKLRIMQDKRRGGYNVQGIDFKGRKVKVHANDREIAANIKAAMGRRELHESDYLNEWDKAAKARRLRDAQNNRAHYIRYADGEVGRFGNRDDAERGAKRDGVSPGKIIGPGMPEYDGAFADWNEQDAKQQDQRNEDNRNNRGIDSSGRKIVSDDIEAIIQQAERDAKADELKAKELKAKKKLAEAAKAPTYDFNDAYQMDDVVEFDGYEYRAKANHAAGPGQPSPRQAKHWERIGPVGAAKTPVSSPATDEPLSTQQIERWNKYMKDLDGAIGDGPNQVDFGNDAKNGIAKRWARAIDAAANGDKPGYEFNLKQLFQLEEQDGEPVDDILDGMDDLLEDIDSVIHDRAFQNVREWGKADGDTKRYMLGAQRQQWKDRKTPTPDPAKSQPPMPPPSGPNLAGIKKHFDDGGSIADAPNGDIVAVVKSMPERFTMHMNGKMGVSPNYWVIDTQRPSDTAMIPTTTKRGGDITWVKTEHETWVFKASLGAEDMQAEVRQDFRGRGIDKDVLAEVVGQNIQSQLGIYSAPARFGSPSGSKNPWVLQKHLSHAGSDSEKGDDKAIVFAHPSDFMHRRGSDSPDSPWKKGDTWLNNLEDPGQLLEMAMFDYLIVNGDRHPGNWSGLVNRDGKIRIGVYDNGLGFRRGGGGPSDLWYDGNLSFGLDAFKAQYGDEAPAKIEAWLNNFIDNKLAGLDKEKVRKRLQDGGASPEYIEVAMGWMDDVDRRKQKLIDQKQEIIKKMRRR